MSIRKKRVFWNRTFTQAFLLALFLHAFPFIVFRIHAFMFKESAYIFPPAVVQIDFEPHRQDILAVNDFEKEKKVDWLMPKLSQVSFSELPFSQDEHSHHFSYDFLLGLSDDCFMEQLLNPRFGNQDSHIAVKSYIQGTTLTPMKIEIANPKLNCEVPWRYAYRVYLHACTGKVVSWELLDHYPSLEVEVETILAKMMPQLSFIVQNLEDNFLIEGTIEFSGQSFDSALQKLWCRCD